MCYSHPGVRGELIDPAKITILFVRRKTGLLFYYNSDLSFMPKTAMGRLPTEPYELKALPQLPPPLPSPKEEDTVLCPVKALKAYLSATADPEFVT